MRAFVFLGAVIGALFLAFGLFISSGAPQQAAMAAMACAFAIIPYIGWRVSQITDAENERRAFRQAVLERLDKLTTQRSQD